MDTPDITHLTAEDLKAYMAGRHEADYLLVDVRQPGEYSAGHIPGAFFLPLAELEAKLFELPDNRDLLFYCRSGARSMTAAFLAAEAEVTEKSVYNLRGGILGWEGKTLTDFPRVQVFDRGRGFSEMLNTAMDLEKGAWRFYRIALEKSAGEPVQPTLEKLSEAETAHARLVYRLWAPGQNDPPAFDPLFESLSGEILEGGEPLAEVLERLDALGENACLDIIELALHIEYSAYDLYRTAAERTEDGQTRDALLSIAQAEKGHMRMLSRAVARCVD
jgi:rhodanese-related sulfurtransferase/rubrerythrin